MRKLIGIAIFLLMVSCGELLLVTVTLAYPFDDASEDTYTVDVDQAMNDADTAIQAQTGGVVDTVLVAAEASIKQELEDQYGTNITVDFSYNPKPTVGLDELLVLLNGETVTQSIQSDVTVKDSSGVVLTTKTETVNTRISICDFAETMSIEMGVITIFLENVDSYCADKTTEQPYLYMEQTTEPVIIKLSEDSDMKDYVHYMDKIFSATINDIGFVVLEVPDGLQGNAQTATEDETLVSLKGDFFSQPLKLIKPVGSEWEECNQDNPSADCVWMGVDADGQPQDFFAGDDITPAGKYYEQFYNVGAFSAENIQENDELFLNYSYYGKDILQSSIKALDFKTGVKARYTFKPGATRMKGKFVAKINAEFVMIVEPF